MVKKQKMSSVSKYSFINPVFACYSATQVIDSYHGNKKWREWVSITSISKLHKHER